MKKLFHIVLEFFVSFLGSEIILTALVLLKSVLNNAINPHFLLLGAISSIPLSIAIACFISFFPLSRLYRSRFLGYLTITTLCWLFFALLSLAVKNFLPGISLIETIEASTAFATGFPWYASSISWLLETGSGPLIETLLHTLAASMMLGACWGITRITKHRPIFGAFITPLCCLFFFFLLSVFRSIPANAIFQYFGFAMPRMMSATILMGLCVPALYLFDLLFSAAPYGLSARPNNA